MENFYENTWEQVVDLEDVHNEYLTSFNIEMDNKQKRVWHFGENHLNSVIFYVTVAFIFSQRMDLIGSAFCH